jgi:hypothetical protein
MLQLNLTPTLYFLNCLLGDLRETFYSGSQALYSSSKETQVSLSDGPDLKIMFEQNDFGLVRKFEIGFRSPLQEESSNKLTVTLSQRVPDNEVSLKDFDTSHSWEFYIHEAWDYAPLQTMAEQLLGAALEFLEFASVPEHFNPTR